MCETCGCGNPNHNHTHIIIPVKGMECDKCAKRIEDALNKLTGIHATVDYELGVASLLLHDDGNLAEAKKVITDMGFNCNR